MYCPNCKTTYSITKTIINLHNLPVDEDVEAKFCPVCGWSSESKIELKEMNIYDKVERYSNCIVEILTNSITGDVSVGWYPTDKTEEIFEVTEEESE